MQGLTCTKAVSMTAKIAADELEIHRDADVLTTFRRRMGNWQSSQTTRTPCKFYLKGRPRFNYE